ncbi:MAG: ATP-dependent RecD-like DNA helicase [Desulfobacterales bacterium]
MKVSRQKTGMLAELKGKIERVTYNNEETGYTVARVKISGRSDLVTVVGKFVSPMPGEVLSMKGEWANHPKYGEQFKVVYYDSTVPASLYGIRKYLESGLITGIGPVMAERIVKQFGKQTLDVIENQIHRLAEVEGIGNKRIHLIRQAWNGQKEIREVMLFLQGHGISSAYASKIYKQYGDRSIAVVKENPYRLAMDIVGIGFLTADKIAEKLGFPNDSLLRVEAGVLFVLNQTANEGHVYYPFEPLMKKCGEVLRVDTAIVDKAMKYLVELEKITIEYIDKDANNSTKTNKAVYLNKFYICETQIAQRLKCLISSPRSLKSVNVEKALDWVQKKLFIRLADDQLEAIRQALTHKALVLTGGPGTGKTTVINAMLKIFNSMDAKCLLAAPTGRAAKRMTEATGYPSKTIHRLLEFSFQSGGFQKNEEKPLNCHVLIVDEASMIDTTLMHHLMKAIPPKATLILVGDVNQLPPVGAGNVLKDIISSKIFAVVQLTKIFRQASKSLIIVNAHRINLGKSPLLPFKNSSDTLGDFYFIQQKDPENILSIILDLIAERIPKRFGFDPVDQVQVLTPMHRGIVGATNLNQQLQQRLNQRKDPLVLGARKFNINDKVMQIRNNYDKAVFNGDIGKIKHIDADARQLFILFDKRLINYDFTELDEIVLAYAISVHKAQGSEYPAVVIPIVTQHFVMLQRNLVYTAVTRAKNLVVMVGKWKALAIGIKNDKTQKRYTLLKERIEFR